MNFSVRQYFDNLNEKLSELPNAAKEFFEDRGQRKELVIPVAIICALAVLSFSLWLASGAASRRLADDKKTAARVETVSREYNSLKDQVDEFRRRAGLSPRQGIIYALDGLFTSTGLKSKVSTVNPLETKTMDGFTSEQAEVTLKKLDLNETVNLLYRIENAPMLLTVKEADFRNSFSAPALDIRLVLALTRAR
ncbi:MAG: hypothetical protein M0Z61_15965 [Nitrospiraceae bacterium]|nr:hypothetical protein [Nitrospiraceae bacterium]